MPHEVLLLSVRPRFAERILAGKKTAELRRVRPQVQPGQRVLIYGSSPAMALLASAVVERVDTGAPKTLWPRVRDGAAVSSAEYSSYFAGAAHAAAIWMTDVLPFPNPISLEELRKRWPWFKPPQSYRFVRASIDKSSGRVKSLRPRAT
jgi:predicted transcriptional regulator